MNSMTMPGTRVRLRGRRTTRVAATVFAAALVLTGCSGGDTEEEAASAPTPETVTVTATAEPTSVPSTEPREQPTSTTEQAPAPTPAECSPADVPLATNAASIAQPFPDRSWAVWRTGNLCGTLGYAELATAGGTGSSPTQLLLYNEGRFLGTGIKCNSLGQVTDSTDDSVSVQYRWPIGDDSNSNMRGRATVTFRWNGSSVDMLGDLPQEALVGC